jgi:hypothetical protein
MKKTFLSLLMIFMANISFSQTTFFVVTTDSVTNVTATTATLSLTGSSTDSVHTGWKIGAFGQFFQFEGFVLTESMLPSVTRTFTVDSLFTGVPYTVQAIMVKKDTAGLFTDTVSVGNILTFTPSAPQNPVTTLVDAIPAYTMSGTFVTATCSITNVSILRLKAGIMFPLQTVQTISPVADGSHSGTFSFTSFTGGSVVNYQWVAYNATGDSVLTSPQSVAVPTSLPGITFATPVLDSVFASGIVITPSYSGTPGVPKTVSYYVYTDSSFTAAVWGNTPPVSTVGSLTTTFTITNLLPNTTYYFLCNGSDSLGADMAVLQFTTLPSLPVSVDPTVSFQITGATQTQISLDIDWTRGSSASVDVIVDYSTNGSFNPVSSMLVTSDTSSTGSYTTGISGLLSSTLYYVRVRVVGSNGLLTTSAVEVTTTLSGGGGTCVPQAPQVQNFAPSTTTSVVTLNGSVISNADSVLVIAEMTIDPTFSTGLVDFPDQGTWYYSTGGCVTANLAVTKTFSSGITFGTYYARFLVVDMYNAPVFSNVVTIVIQNPIMPTVSGLAVDSTNHNSVHINFITDGDGASTQYIVRYSYNGIQDSLGWMNCSGNAAIQFAWITGLPASTPISIEVEIAGGNMLNLNTSTTAAPFVPFSPTTNLLQATVNGTSVTILGNVISNAGSVVTTAEISNTNFATLVASSDTTFTGASGTISSFSFYKTITGLAPGTYLVKLTSTDMVNPFTYSSIFSITVVNTTGIEELQANVQYIGDVKIFSVTGALVYQAGNEEVTLQNLNEKIMDQSNGVYIYHIEMKNGDIKRGKFFH